MRHEPHEIPLGEWQSHGITLVGACSCGRTVPMLTWSLIQLYGEASVMDVPQLMDLTAKTKCSSCEGRDVAFSFEVRQ